MVMILSRWLRSVVLGQYVGSALLIGVSIGLSSVDYDPAHAQEFDFTPSGASVNPTPGAPGSNSSESIPTMPVLPQAQQPAGSGALPPVPESSAAAPIDPVLAPSQPTQSAPSTRESFPIPVVPTGSSATNFDPTSPYSYQRLPDNAPGIVSATIGRGQLTAGSSIPLTVYREISFPPFQAISGNLEVANPVLDVNGQVVIPAGSVVWGTFEPILEDQDRVNLDHGTTDVEEKVVGSRFVANRITIQSATYVVNGQSGPLDVGLDPQGDLGTVAARGAGYGAAGGVVVGALTGGIGFLPILAGSLAGAAAGSTNVDRVVSLKPNQLVMVELTDDLILQ